MLFIFDKISDLGFTFNDLKEALINNYDYFLFTMQLWSANITSEIERTNSN